MSNTKIYSIYKYLLIIIIIINFHQEFIFFLCISFNFCYWQWRKVDGSVIMKPREFEVSYENYLSLII